MRKIHRGTETQRERMKAEGNFLLRKSKTLTKKEKDEIGKYISSSFIPNPLFPPCLCVSVFYIHY